MTVNKPEQGDQFIDEETHKAVEVAGCDYGRVHLSHPHNQLDFSVTDFLRRFRFVRGNRCLTSLSFIADAIAANPARTVNTLKLAHETLIERGEPCSPFVQDAIDAGFEACDAISLSGNKQQVLAALAGWLNADTRKGANFLGWALQQVGK